MGEKLPVDIKKVDTNDPRAVAVRKCDVVADHKPRPCLLTLSINEDSCEQVKCLQQH